ncbi:MAG: CRISPR-associated protein Csx11 [Deltaproteobacteria bacterium]|nr:CRISPR-associated protein Csx11 [Deltaproteobacteria bacterium]
MCDLLSKIEKHKEAILLGEIGALLHDFGKMDRRFVQRHSVEGGDDYNHASKCVFSPELLPRLEKIEVRFDQNFRVPLIDVIVKHHDQKATNNLIKAVIAADRMNSADDKGVVRRKQSITDMWITTPFGFKAKKIDPDCLDIRRQKVDNQLVEAFDSYLQQNSSVGCLRDQVSCIVEPGFSEALGETRMPANDVTLWEHSYGVASLYKPILSAVAMGCDPCPKGNDGYDFNKSHWRLFGIGWNGLGFIQKGRKPGDILKRQEIIQTIQKEVRDLIEVSYPIGNLIYADLNGVFFTFPALDNDLSGKLAKALAKKVVLIIYNRSDNELWPFFTLSRPRRTLTALTQEMHVRNRLSSYPKIAPILSMEGDTNRQETSISKAPDLILPGQNKDICPLCQLRSKSAEKEKCCQICISRRSGRQDTWKQNRTDNTIWIDEVADRNNRVALITLQFDLSRWLSGEWLSTIFSQTIRDWYQKIRSLPNQERNKLQRKINEKPTESVSSVLKILNLFTSESVENDPRFKAAIINTFFEEIKSKQEKNHPLYVKNVFDNLTSRIETTTNNITGSVLATALFTQNPSPARLYRIWRETETFFNLFVGCLRQELLVSRPTRLRFRFQDEIFETNPGKTYRVTIPGLGPAPLVVLALEDKRTFITIDSIDKFVLKKASGHTTGMKAVREALVENGAQKWQSEDTGKIIRNNGGGDKADSSGFKEESYLPFIILAQSPVFFQILVPALSVPRILQRIYAFYKERYAKVRGKLPLHIGVLVAKRKLPLYTLFEAGRRILNHPSSGEPKRMHPWWNTFVQGATPFYDHYPTGQPQDSHFKLDYLKPINRGDLFFLSPGYFDFDLLLSTTDRYRLIYRTDNKRLKRAVISYGWIRPRPIFLHELKDVFFLWEILRSKLTSSQRHKVEQILTTKLWKWRTEARRDQKVFYQFALAVLKDAFGDKWKNLEKHQRNLIEYSIDNGMLLEALQFFEHTIKEEEDE